MNLTIAIDGPAGAGKSTVAKLIASKMGISYLDTGAMYRAVALRVSRAGIDLHDAAAIAQEAEKANIEFGPGDPQRVILDGEDVTDQIRSLEIGELASAISAFGPVRKVLVAQQKHIIETADTVLEGRDATTVIAPEAEVKIYLTASLEERAKRRYQEVADKAQYGEVRRALQDRDHRDITRDDSPLLVAPGAEVIESGGLTPNEIAERIIEMARRFQTN
ncbi:MAG: (d)CMP kinase [Armatimonadetes bacterium]|nr:(d)CMP kinase [Armatimonadota bacterium]